MQQGIKPFGDGWDDDFDQFDIGFVVCMFVEGTLDGIYNAWVVVVTTIINNSRRRMPVVRFPVHVLIFLETHVITITIIWMYNLLCLWLQKVCCLVFKIHLLLRQQVFSLTSSIGSSSVFHFGR
jgi:hypothetical protein